MKRVEITDPYQKAYNLGYAAARAEMLENIKAMREHIDELKGIIAELRREIVT